MSDLVEKLRKGYSTDSVLMEPHVIMGDCLEAADKIEELAHQVEILQGAINIAYALVEKSQFITAQHHLEHWREKSSNP